MKFGFEITKPEKLDFDGIVELITEILKKILDSVYEFLSNKED